MQGDDIMAGPPEQKRDPFDLSVDADPDAAAAFASPPCFLHELDPTWLGYAGREEVLGWLNQLLEAERAGARGIGELSGRVEGDAPHPVLRDIARDEARFCAMLTRHIGRLGGTASTQTGAFYGKLAALGAADDWPGLLDRGQGWVVRRLEEMLPRIGDEALHADLTEMREAHLRNLERCRTLRT
jgi:hypothetical protein